MPVELPAAVGHRQHERGGRQGDHDRGEHHRLRERVGDRLGGALLHDRGRCALAAGDQEGEAHAVAHQQEADQHPGQAALEQQVDPAADQRGGGDHQGQVDVVHRAPLSAVSVAPVAPVSPAGGARGAHGRGVVPVLGGAPVADDLPVDLRAERAEQVQDQADHDQVDPDVEEDRGDQVDLAQQRQRDVDDRALQHRGAEEQRHDGGQRGDRETAADQLARVDGRGLVELVATAREVADHQRQPGHHARREAAAGVVVTGQQQVERDHDDAVEDQPGEHLEDDRPVLRGQGPRRRQPGPTAGDLRLLADARRVGDLVDAADAGAAGVEEDQAGHAGGGRDQHGDLTEGVPGADVDQDDVDDVVAAAVLDGQLGQRRRDRLGGPRRGAEQQEPGHRDADTQAQGHPQVPATGQRPVGEVLRQPAQREHRDHDREGLDQHLGQRQVGGALDQEEQRGAEAGDTGQQDRAEPAPGAGRHHRRDHDHHADRRLHRGLPGGDVDVAALDQAEPGTATTTSRMRPRYAAAEPRWTTPVTSTAVRSSARMVHR